MPPLKITIFSVPFIIFLIFTFQSCQVPKQNNSANFSFQENIPLIIFLNCSITYDTIQQEHKMHLINKIITEGRLKNTTTNENSIEKGDFRYCFLDKHNKVMSHLYIPNPLYKTIEFVDENENLAKMDVKLDSTKFSLRIPIPPQINYISFEMENKRLLLIDLRADK